MIAFMYPGQGSQYPGMLCDRNGSPAQRRTYEEAGDLVVNYDQLDQPDSLESTTRTQLALLIAGVGAARALMEDYGVEPQVVAGHSVGAFAAAVTTGVLNFPEAINAVIVRGQLMEEVCANHHWAMAAVVGLNKRSAQTIIDTVSTDIDPLWIANINADNQIVFSGTVDSLHKAEDLAYTMGFRRFEKLHVSVASHCPLLEPVTIALRSYFSAIPARVQKIPYYTNSTAQRIVGNSIRVLEDLACSVSQTVRWASVVAQLSELGIGLVLEMPPGHVLTQLVNADTLRAISIEDQGLETAAYLCRLRGAQ